MADPAKPADLEGSAHAAKPAAEPARVFISYSSHDAGVAHSVCSALEAAGFTCWIAPRDVVPGKLYADGIIRAINESTILVVILSEHAVASAHVGKELERASSKRHPIIALRTDTAPLIPAFEYFLSESQWIDVGAAGVDGAIGKLTEAVGRHLNSDFLADTGHRETATQPTAQHPGTSPPAAQPSKGLSRTENLGRPVIVMGVLIALVVVYLAGDKIWQSKTIPEHPVAAVTPNPSPAAATVSDKSVAVLPFVDMSENKDQEYFTDGLSEELIDHLAHANNLKVIARTSSFQFKGKNVDMRTIGQQLGVANLLEGSVRKSGKKLRITAQLIRASDGSHLWSQTYDRALVDVFSIQDQIADAVVQALQVAIDGNQIHDGGDQDNIEAYNLVLEGDFYKARYNIKDLKRAIDLFEQAIKLQRDNARAWARLGSAYLNMAQRKWAPRVPSLARSRQALQEALRIDSSLIWAHYTMSGLHMTEWDLVGAQSEIDRIQMIDPTDKNLLPAAIGDMKLIKGDIEGALAIQRSLIQRDPLNTYTMENLAQSLFYARHFEESAAVSRRLIQQDPSHAGSQSALGITLVYLGRSSDALQSIEQETDESSRLSALPVVYWALDRRADSNAALEKYSAMHGDDDATGIAEIHAYRGEFNLALQWLERAYRQHEDGLIDIKSDLFFRDMAASPGFKALLHKLNLPE